MLAIDTSSPAVTAGIVTTDGGPALVAERAPLAARGHGELLSPAIADCLQAAGCLSHRKFDEESARSSLNRNWAKVCPQAMRGLLFEVNDWCSR